MDLADLQSEASLAQPSLASSVLLDSARAPFVR